MKRLVSKAIAAGATVVGSSIAFATSVAAQTYSYDYTPYTYSTGDAAAGGLFATFGIVIYCCIACVPLIVLIALAYYVYRDAQKYQVENAALWAVLTFFTGLIGLLIYFLAIRPEAVKKMESKGVTHSEPVKVETPKSE